MELCMTPKICIQIANSRLGVQLSVGMHSPARNPGFNPKYFKEFPWKVIWGNLKGLLFRSITFQINIWKFLSHSSLPSCSYFVLFCYFFHKGELSVSKHMSSSLLKPFMSTFSVKWDFYS